MIINLRGTSGSGKTTAVRSLMEALGGMGLRMKVGGRKRPIAHVYQRVGPFASVAVVGSYETACGGCDTISKYDTCYDLIKQLEDNGIERVVYEGLRHSGDAKRALDLLSEGRDIRVINLTTPLEDCLEAVRQRRVARGADPEFNTTNTEAKFNLIERANTRLREAGVEVHDVDREAASELLRELCHAPT